MTRSASEDHPVTVGVVLLTQGKRTTELNRAVASVLAQREVTIDLVVVGNAWEPTGLPDGTKTVHLPVNVGIPAGRNAGVPHVSGELLLFLDDDAWLLDADFLSRCAALMRADPSVGMIQPRICDPDDDRSPQRWIPRLLKQSPEHSSDVFSVVEMAVVVQRRAYDLVPNGWPAPFFYAHEGIELAWRIWDAGYRTWYAGDLRAGHPVIDPRRHAEYLRHNARNRVWLARRNLPVPIRQLYVASWTLVQLARSWRHPHDLADWFAGWRAGWRDDPWEPQEQQHPIRWRSVGRMARHGRLPLL